MDTTISKGHSCYRPRRTGERKRKSVRGCIVAMDLSVIALSIVKKGEADIPGVTDTVAPKRLGLQHKRHRVALKRRRAEASKDAANEYAQILQKRLSEAKNAHDEAKKRRASSIKH